MIELLLVINLRVKTLIQPGALSIERSTYAQSQNWCSKHVYEVYRYITKNFCHRATVSPFYLLLCSGGVHI